MEKEYVIKTLRFCYKHEPEKIKQFLRGSFKYWQKGGRSQESWDRTKFVLFLTCCLPQDKRTTATRIGRVIGVGRERVRQIKDFAIRCCKHPSRRQKINRILGSIIAQRVRQAA